MSGDFLEGDSVAEVVEVSDGLVAPVVVVDVAGEPVGAEVGVVDVVGEDVPGGDEDGVADGHGCFLLADATCERRLAFRRAAIVRAVRNRLACVKIFVAFGRNEQF